MRICFIFYTLIFSLGAFGKEAWKICDGLSLGDDEKTIEALLKEHLEGAREKYSSKNFEKFTRLIQKQISENEVGLVNGVCNMKTEGKALLNGFDGIMNKSKKVNDDPNCAPTCSPEKIKGVTECGLGKPCCAAQDTDCIFEKLRCAVAYEGKKPGFGAATGPIGLPEKYDRLKKLIACEHAVAKAVFELSKSLDDNEKKYSDLSPQFSMSLFPRGDKFIFKWSGGADTIVCERKGPKAMTEREGLPTAENLEFPISRGLACLLKRAGYFDGESSEFTPPAPAPPLVQGAAAYDKAHKAVGDQVGGAAAFIVPLVPTMAVDPAATQ